jgi:peptidoglycan/LPS O-acetylase OafA/YrhL
MVGELNGGPSAKTRMASVQAARGIAALMVMFMHTANLMDVPHFLGHVGMGRLFDFGYVGVDFFFVLSGFIITYVHYAEIGRFQSIPRYLWRRFSRIYPIYWAILILIIGVTLAGRMATGRPFEFEIGITDISGTVFLLMSDEQPKYIGVAWTLQFEVLFYLMFCLLLISARLGAIVFTTWGLVVLARALGFVHVQLPLNLGNAHCFEFLAGVALGVSAREFSLKTSRLWLGMAILVFVAATLFEVYGPFGRHSPIGRITLGIASAGILAVLVGLERQRDLSVSNWLVRLGSVSYSIYLGHILFISLTYMIFLKLGLYHQFPEGFLFLCALVSALVGTMLIGMYVELPLINVLKDRWWRKITE